MELTLIGDRGIVTFTPVGVLPVQNAECGIHAKKLLCM